MKLDMHIHSEKSYDGVLSREQIKQRCKALGLDGVAICDHQVSPTELEINSWMEEDFYFIPAIEYSTQFGHLIGMFLERPVGKTERERTDFFEAVGEIRSAGGICILAHPFERADHRKQRSEQLEQLLPNLDGIEIMNSRADYKFDGANCAAAEFAEAHNIICRTGGSDAHRLGELGATVTVIDADRPEQLKEALLKGAAVSGKNSRRAYIGLSQLAKARKMNLGVKRTLKSFALLCYLTGKDILKKWRI